MPPQFTGIVHSPVRAVNTAGALGFAGGTVAPIGMSGQSGEPGADLIDHVRQPRLAMIRRALSAAARRRVIRSKSCPPSARPPGVKARRRRGRRHRSQRGHGSPPDPHGGGSTPLAEPASRLRREPRRCRRRASRHPGPGNRTESPGRSFPTGALRSAGAPHRVLAAPSPCPCGPVVAPTDPPHSPRPSPPFSPASASRDHRGSYPGVRGAGSGTRSGDRRSGGPLPG